MKLSKRLMKQVEKLDEAQTNGKELNRRQKRLLEAATKKLNK